MHAQTVAPRQERLRREPVRCDPLVVDDPYPVYRRLRDETPPCHDEARGIWAFSRSEDVQRAARDWRTFSSREGNDHDDGYQLFQPAGGLAALDPPEHTRLRDALHGAFHPSDIRARFEPAVRVKAQRLIDRFADRGSADLAQELARPLPGDMICTWLGFPDDNHPQLPQWFGHMVDRIPGQPALPASAFGARDRMRDVDRYLQRSLDVNLDVRVGVAGRRERVDRSLEWEGGGHDPGWIDRPAGHETDRLRPDADRTDHALDAQGL